jgi:hypothetical protein
MLGVITAPPLLLGVLLLVQLKTSFDYHCPIVHITHGHHHLLIDDVNGF